MVEKRRLARLEPGLGEAIQNAVDEIAVGGRRFGKDDRAGLGVVTDKIGKRAADVDGH